MTIAPIARGLTGESLRSVILSSGVQAVVTTPQHAEAVRAATVDVKSIVVRLCTGSTTGFDEYEDALSSVDDALPVRETLGTRMTYSSGTTGRPKGIRHPRTHIHPADAPPHLGPYTDLLSLDADTVYLSPAPMYYTTPLRFGIAVVQQGGTVICQERFDAEDALAAIERHRVTHAQFVPTMLTRMLALPRAVRERYDLSSLRVAITGAASCPPEVKDRIEQWWGPILHEYYGASEGYGNTHIGPEEARLRRGSVGRALRGTIHILHPDDPDGPDLPVGDIGQIWFEGTTAVAYEGDPDKTRAATNAAGRVTVGDLGRIDEDGYLYLSGRADHLIVSGGVNVHPQPIEDRLISHPAVADAAVIGVPDDDLGQRVHAVVVVERNAYPDGDLVSELLDFVREHIPKPQAPRTLEFRDRLPRAENGKLYKRQIRIPDSPPDR